MHIKLLDSSGEAVEKGLFMGSVILKVPIFKVVCMFGVVVCWYKKMGLLALLPLEIGGRLRIDKVRIFEEGRAAGMFTVCDFLSH